MIKHPATWAAIQIRMMAMGSDSCRAEIAYTRIHNYITWFLQNSYNSSHPSLLSNPIESILFLNKHTWITPYPTCSLEKDMSAEIHMLLNQMKTTTIFLIPLLVHISTKNQTPSISDSNMSIFHELIDMIVLDSARSCLEQHKRRITT